MRKVAQHNARSWIKAMMRTVHPKPTGRGRVTSCQYQRRDLQIRQRSLTSLWQVGNHQGPNDRSQRTPSDYEHEYQCAIHQPTRHASLGCGELTNDPCSQSFPLIKPTRNPLKTHDQLVNPRSCNPRSSSRRDSLGNGSDTADEHGPHPNRDHDRLNQKEMP